MDSMSPSPSNEEIVDWDRVALSNYSVALLSPQKWFETANQIGAAMAILEPQILAEWETTREWARGRGIFPEHSLCGTYMMLAGLVIENLCKGNAVDGLTPSQQMMRHKLEKQVANGKLKQTVIVRQCWKLTFDERERAKVTGQLPQRLTGHDLLRFVANTGLCPIDIAEEELLERLKRAVLWFGRYPVPKDFRNHDKKRLSDGKLHSTSWVGGADSPRINSLIKRLRDHVGARESYRVTG